ncbi:MAG: helix-turn-helix transcriptional regulator [Clostridia bacterium]|nr:helix-turn-helix transcriptional regulator [Clostridia bacterium]
MQNLQNLRKNRKLKQSDVASAIHVATSTYSCWENDISEPDFASLKKLSDFFEVSTDVLLDRESLTINKINNTIAECKHRWLITLSPLQQTLIETMLKLNELQQHKVQAYMYGMID